MIQFKKPYLVFKLLLIFAIAIEIIISYFVEIFEN